MKTILLAAFAAIALTSNLPEAQDSLINDILPHAMPTWLVYDSSQFENIDQFLSMYPPSRVRSSHHPWIYVPGTSGPVKSGDVQSLLKTWQMFARSGRASQPLLLYLAEKHQVLAGKWLIYVSQYEVDDAWERIAKLVVKGELGVAAKVSPHSPTQLMHCICVYNNNFLDKKTIKEVRQQLRELGFTKPIEYKPDAYTHAGIYPGNVWNIPEGLYRE